MQLHGDWPDALDEAVQACEWLTRPPGEPAAGAAHYRRAELHRLRGEFAEAETAYRTASVWGANPQPGLALLRFAQGRTGIAEAAIRRALDDARGMAARSRVLPAFVEIVLAGGDTDAARAAVDELAALAEETGATLLRGVADQSRGALLLADDDAAAAIPVLRSACAAWTELAAPYELARCRMRIGLARRALGDHDTAALDFDAARVAFQQLGAAPDLARLEALTRPGKAGAAGRLTQRELQVLRLVAAGATNRAVANELSISERTVERHLANIFTKLQVPSRTAATAYAYEHRLL
jgi:DNA-binding NarL/FixJ family response regulator